MGGIWVMQGPILAFIYAVKEMLEEGHGTDASLPVNVAFVFEGEEENGMSDPLYACCSSASNGTAVSILC